MSELEKRRNGLFTCLDCSKSKSHECGECVSNNWKSFNLDNELVGMSYTEKSERYALK